MGMVLGAVLGGRAAWAQTLDVRLRGGTGQDRVAGAIVRLLGDGGVVYTGLSNHAGNLTIRLPGPGTYRLRIDRIGESTVFTDPIVAGGDQTIQKVVLLGSSPVRLPSLEARGDGRCAGRGIQGSGAAALWDELQKALTVTVLASEGGTTFRYRDFRRERNAVGQVLREWTSGAGTSHSRPYRTLSPQELSARGFVFNIGDTAVFAAPDAALLLSEEFISTHCFTTALGPNQLAGLAFRPVPGRRVADVSGTLWLDRPTNRLQSLEFTYTGLAGPLQRLGLGGKVEFDVVDTGEWIVSRWEIRMPRVNPRSRGPSRPGHFAGYTETGGVAAVAANSAAVVPSATLLGRVYDSTAGSGMAGAVVAWSGGQDVVTDSAGWFQFVSKEGGAGWIAVRDSRLGSLGEPTRLEIVLSVGSTTIVEFAVPPVAAFQQHHCPGVLSSGRVNIVGRARSQATPAAAKLEVLALRRTGGGAALLPVRAGKQGSFAVCQIPNRGVVVLSLRRGGRTVAETRVQLGGAGPLWVDLYEPHL